MLSRKCFYKQFKGFRVGPGGMGCPCCAPSPKDRKVRFRAGKKAERVFVKKHYIDCVDD